MHENLPRLAPESYRGFAFVHWVMTLERRQTGWLNERFHFRFREVLLHTTTHYDLICPVYCVMPDHLHMLWLGIDEKTDQRLAAQFFRRHSNPFLAPSRWQKQAFDHVLREDERKQDAVVAVSDYILLNPVRAKLIEQRGRYSYSGAIIPGHPGLDPGTPGYWATLWMIYNRLVDGSARH